MGSRGSPGNSASKSMNLIFIFKGFIATYLAKIKNLSFLLVIFFFFSIFLGYGLAHGYPRQTETTIYNGLKDMIEPAKTYSPIQLFALIFFKNSIVAIISVLSGIIFGIIPILIIFTNGLILGIISYVILGQYNILILSAGILPHGIIEIPALILSAASGIRLWQSLYHRILYDKGELGNEFLSIIAFFTLIIMPMLAIAALIETFITPHILDSAIILFNGK